MKIAIHHNPGSFSDRWTQYCNENNVHYKLVNAYSSDIIEQVMDCDAFMWHHDHNCYKDLILAKKVLFALEHSGKLVFPNFNTGWHFDDKVAQKYLLESIGAPLVPSYVFYDKNEAVNWVKQTTFPKVFKLKGGSGSSNVRLVHSKNEALRLIAKSFGVGIVHNDFKSYAKEKLRHFTKNGYKVSDLLKIAYRFFFSPELSKHISRERDYAYFQDFCPNNNYDVRIILINNKALAINRMVRENDFRASGSGLIDYDNNNIDLKCVELAFGINKRLKSDCVSYDFIYNENKPLVVEISYGFSAQAYRECLGFWTEDLKWHKSEFYAEDWIINDIIEKLKL